MCVCVKERQTETGADISIPHTYTRERKRARARERGRVRCRQMHRIHARCTRRLPMCVHGREEKRQEGGEMIRHRNRQNSIRERECVSRDKVTSTGSIHDLTGVWPSTPQRIVGVCIAVSAPPHKPKPPPPPLSRVGTAWGVPGAEQTHQPSHAPSVPLAPALSLRLRSVLLH